MNAAHFAQAKKEFELACRSYRMETPRHLRINEKQYKAACAAFKIAEEMYAASRKAA